MVDRAVAMVERQSDVDCEVIVVDDGSRPEQGRRLDTLSDSGRALVVRHHVSRGVAAARNSGIGAANAAWIAFLDDDDQWAPEKLRLQLDAAARASAEFVYGPVAVTDGKVTTYVDSAPDSEALLETLLRWNEIPAGSSNVLATAAALEAVGGWDERFDHMPDWDLWIRLAAGHTAATIPTVAVAYLTHPGSMLTDSDGLDLEMDLLAAKHEELSRRTGIRFDRLRFDRWAALGYRRRGRRLRAAAEYVRVGARHRSPSDLARGVACIFGERVIRAGKPSGPLPSWFEPLSRIAVNRDDC
jgi:glycosyltransferase involved in cell wall biosynthesis